MSHELRALAGRYEIAAQAARGADSTVVELPQGYGLLPVTRQVLDRLGDDVRPFGDVFWFLSAGIETLARRISRAGEIAYLEANMFGGTGTQAVVVWSDGEVCLGPVTTVFRPDAPEPTSSPAVVGIQPGTSKAGREPGRRMR